jgi:hypothetical protein
MYVKGKAILQQAVETHRVGESLRLPHFLDNWFTNGGEVVSPTHWPMFTPRKIPGTHSFLFKAELTPGP